MTPTIHASSLREHLDRYAAVLSRRVLHRRGSRRRTPRFVDRFDDPARVHMYGTSSLWGLVVYGPVRFSPYRESPDIPLGHARLGWGDPQANGHSCCVTVALTRELDILRLGSLR